jgi:hypothetical protein
MPDRKEKSQLLGDFLREIAVLVIVFLPIDAWLQGKLDWVTFALAAALAGTLLWFGMILEGRDEL